MAIMRPWRQRWRELVCRWVDHDRAVVLWADLGPRMRKLLPRDSRIHKCKRCGNIRALTKFGPIGQP